MNGFITEVIIFKPSGEILNLKYLKFKQLQVICGKGFNTIVLFISLVKCFCCEFFLFHNT